MENLTISKENAVKAFEATNSKGKNLLKNLFGEEVFAKNIIERIDSLEAALKYNGKTMEQFNHETERDTDGQRAGKELEEIALALRKGKELDMSQRWYYPYFRRTAGSVAGFSFCDYFYGNVDSNVGARLCVDTAEKAIYMGKKFTDIYTRYLSPKKPNN